VTTAAVIVGFVPPVLAVASRIETILAPPIHVRFRATGTLADQSIAPDALGIPTASWRSGRSSARPMRCQPVVTVVYRLGRDAFQPYGRRGASVPVAYNARATNPVLNRGSSRRCTSIRRRGWSCRPGSNVRIWHRVHARVDVKYIAFMTAHATVDNIRVRTPDLPLFDTVAVGPRRWTSRSTR